MRAVETIDQVASSVTSALRGPGGTAEAIRIAFAFVPAFDRASPGDRVRMVRGRPAATGDERFDALLAAMVEHLCARWGVPVPGWVDDPDRYVEPWWFVSGLRNLHASALAESPISFARHGVFVCDGALSYA